MDIGMDRCFDDKNAEECSGPAYYKFTRLGRYIKNEKDRVKNRSVALCYYEAGQKRSQLKDPTSSKREGI